MPDQTEATVDHDRLQRRSQRHVRATQQPKPHGVAADESERHLLKKKSAEGYLDSLAQAAVSSQRLKNKLQSETGDQAGLTREQNQRRYQREGAQLIQMGEHERKIDLRNYDRDRQNR